MFWVLRPVARLPLRNLLSTRCARFMMGYMTTLTACCFPRIEIVSALIGAFSTPGWPSKGINVINLVSELLIAAVRGSWFGSKRSNQSVPISSRLHPTSHQPLESKRTALQFGIRVERLDGLACTWLNKCANL